MDAEHLAGLVARMVSPGTVAGLLETIRCLVDGMDTATATMATGGSSGTVVVEPVPRAGDAISRVEAWVAIPGELASDNPFTGAALRRDALSGNGAARAGIVASMVHRIEHAARDPFRRPFRRVVFHSWAPGNDLAGPLLIASPPGSGFVVCEPTGMVPCTVETARHRLRVFVDPAEAGPLATALRGSFTPRHDLYPLDNPVLAGKFLTGATIVIVEPGEQPGTLELACRCPPGGHAAVDGIVATIHEVAGSLVPPVQARVEVLDSFPGVSSSPSSWLLDRVTEWFLATTGEHPYLDWHVSRSLAGLVARSVPGAPWVVVGPGAAGKKERVALAELTSFISLLERMQGAWKKRA